MVLNASNFVADPLADRNTYNKVHHTLYRITKTHNSKITNKYSTISVEVSGSR